MSGLENMQALTDERLLVLQALLGELRPHSVDPGTPA